MCVLNKYIVILEDVFEVKVLYLDISDVFILQLNKTSLSSQS